MFLLHQFTSYTQIWEKNPLKNAKSEMTSLASQLHLQRTFDLNFNSEIRRDHGKNFLWAPRPWVGRR